MKGANFFSCRRLVRSASVLALILAISACSAAEPDKPSEGWRNDCVGRLALSIPRDSETAASSASDLSERLSGRHGMPATFDDGDDADWTNLFDGRGITWVSPKLTQAQIDGLRKRWEDDLVRGIENAKREAKLVSRQLEVDYSKIDIGRPLVQASRLKESFDFRAAFGDRVVDGNFPMTITTPQADKAYVAQMMDNISRRELFEVPKMAGLCYPYFFLKDDGSSWRRISMSYRSKSRPDVHFVLHDGTADEQDSAKPRDVANPLHWVGGEADRKIVSHWNQRSIEGTIKPQWWPLTRTHTLAGQPGRESFIELTRRDNGTVDYEYFAYARGDPKAVEDTPDIWLYVYTRMDYGKSKGLAPITKKDFLALAQAVAASVKRRQVQ